MNNYSGCSDKDAEIAAELVEAGIEVNLLPESLRSSNGEVKTVVTGILHGWVFERAWYYWVCHGPGIPLKEAMALHDKFGKVVRVDGDAGCASPLEQFQGLGTGHYHVDSQEGLNALAQTIKTVVQNATQALKV